MNRTKGLPSRWPRVAPVAACLFLALQAGATASHAQVNFEQHVLSDDEDGANSVQAADMDGDGDTDVVLASAFQDDEITWYENDGNHPASFEERLVASSVGHPQDIFATDLDGDGDVDVLAAKENGVELVWYENDGGAPPGFTERIVSEMTEDPSSVFAADLDDDGDTDVVSGMIDRVVWYENDGGSTPTFQAHLLSTSVHREALATDVDGDGDTDVVSLHFGGDRVSWFENDGGSPPAFVEHVVSSTAGGPTSLFATDLDSDGDTDVLLAGDDIAWFENDGNSPPAFVKRVIEAMGFPGFDEVSAGDLDGDGDVDVLAAGLFEEELPWYESDGASPPAFIERIVTEGVDGAKSLVATDLDDDEDNDILLASNAFDPMVRLVWFENHGTQIPCIDVESLIARCDSSATLQVRVTMTDESHDGESVTIGIDAAPHVRPIVGAVASLRELDAGFGPHTVTLEEPAACVAPVVTECVALPVGGAVTGMSGNLVICLNETTGQSVQIPDATSWDCEAAGLVVRPGDVVRQMAVGDVD